MEFASRREMKKRDCDKVCRLSGVGQVVGQAGGQAVGQAAGQAGQIGSKDDGCDGKAALNWLEGGISDRKLE